MVKSKKKLYLFKIFIYVFLGLLCYSNNNLYAMPGINWQNRKIELEAEQNNLLVNLSHTYNNMTITSEARMSLMHVITERLEEVQNQLNQAEIEIARINNLRTQRDTRTNNSNNSSNNHRSNNHR
ncbi:SVM family protein ['Camptotheca acuminata' phytoplasma]|uniref:SVM family protein n=1 Tax='Camptotheca acuminata' phytoplasma TaxID=3239192 RepID=UPI00351A3ED6